MAVLALGLSAASALLNRRDKDGARVDEVEAAAGKVRDDLVAHKLYASEAYVRVAELERLRGSVERLAGEVQKLAEAFARRGGA